MRQTIIKRETAAVWAGMLLFTLAGAALVIYATRYGIGVGGDATIYLTSAANFQAGKGLGWVEADGSFRLLPYTPPFYPLALSALAWLTPDLVSGARWLNVLLFGLTVLLCGWAVYRATRRAWLAVLSGGVLALSPVVIGVQVWAMSEPLFLLLGFAGLLALLEHLDCPRWLVLSGAALLCGLAFLSRYIGVAFVITGGLALLLLGRGPDARLRLRLGWAQIREAALFGFIAILPILTWLVIDFSLTGTVGSRSGQPAGAYWQRFLAIGPALQQIYLFWLLPDSVSQRLPGVVQAALWLIPLAGLAALAVVLARPAARAGEPRFAAPAVRLVWMLGLFVLVYLLVLAVVQVFTYPPITLASRMLSPVHVAALLLVFVLLHLTLERFGSRWRWLTVIAALGCFGLVGVYGLRSALIARDYHNTGIGYTSPTWRESRTIEVAAMLPKEIPLISNETTALMFLTGRPAYALQEIYQDHPQEEFTVYGTGDDPAQVVFRERVGALVLFKSTLGSDFAMYGDQAEARIQALTKGLYIYYDGPDGAIYFAEEPYFVPASDCL